MTITLCATSTGPKTSRYCLACLKHGNPRNEADILQAVRTSPALARDFERLRDALELLRRDDDSGACASPARAAAARAERAALRAAAAAQEEEDAQRARAAARAARCALRSSEAALSLQLAQASADAARAAARAASIGRTRPFSAASAATAAAAAATAAVAATEAAEASWAWGCGRAASPARRSAKSPLGKHIFAFNCDEVGRFG